MKNVMTINKHYLVKSDGTKLFFINLATNPVYYSITASLTPVPTTLGTYTNPENIPLNGKAPQLNIKSDSVSRWGRLVGFTEGSYPPTLTTAFREFNSTTPPVLSPVTIVNVVCDWVFENRFDNNFSVIGSFVPESSFGSTLTYQPTNLIFTPVVQRQWAEISISF